MSQKAEARKAAYIKSLHEVIEKCRRAIEAAEDIDPLNVNTGEEAYKRFSDIEQMLTRAYGSTSVFEHFTNIFLPTGANMNLYLRSGNWARPVKIGGAEFGGHSIHFDNLHSGRQNKIDISTLLGWGSANHNIEARAAIINEQLPNL